LSIPKATKVNENFWGFRMEVVAERRREQRLRYHWPVWFAEDFNEILLQGQMVDISSGGAAFTYYADGNCPEPGQSITARFSVPCFGADESFEMAHFTRHGRICRVDNMNHFLRRIAIQFAEPLPFKPGEQKGTRCQTEEDFASVVAYS
jgi:hypothetical protein